MKRFYSTLLLLCIIFSAFSQNKIPVTLTIHDIGSKGDLYIAIYHSAETFLKENKTFLHKIEKNVNTRTIDIELGSLPAGKYAVAVFLDKNGNGQLDKNFLGIPNEPYGFTGSNLPKMRAPHFNESAIDINQQQNKLRISL